MSNATPKSHSLVARLTSAALLGGRAVRNKAPIASTLAVLLLAPGLSGCILGTERPELNLEIPAAYREAQKRAPDAAVPALDWWRGFRSAELTSLMEQAQAANLDIAIAMAQILQADAQVRIAGASLLPLIDLNGNETASKTSQQLGTGAG